MKFLKDREEICRALNLMKYPVIIFDLTEKKAGYDGATYVGTPVRVDIGRKFSDGTPMYRDCTPFIFVDVVNNGRNDTVENRLKSDIHLLGETVGLYADFNVDDLIERAEFAQAPVIKAHQEVVVVYKWKTHKGMKAAVRMMKVSRVGRFECPVAMIRDEEDGNGS